MTREDRRRLLEELGKTNHGKALREFLAERRETIGDITSCKNWEEAVGRQFALVLLKEMFSFLDEKPSTPPVHNQYM